VVSGFSNEDALTGVHRWVKCEFYACFGIALYTSRGIIPSPPGIAWPGCLSDLPPSEKSTLIAWSVIQFDTRTKLIYQRIPCILVGCK